MPRQKRSISSSHAFSADAKVPRLLRARVHVAYDGRHMASCVSDFCRLGLESSDTSYAKLKGTDTLTLVRELQAHGICVHGSTIIGLEHHTPENIGADIDRAVAHETVFHQFMR